MTSIDDALLRLRATPASRGVGFSALGGPLESRWQQAHLELAQCIRPLAGSVPVLNEGGVYYGSWIESTGTINAEVLSRFDPAVTTATHLLFASHQRDDGMIPYKVTDAGPAFSQIQIVTPFARSVWNHYLLADPGLPYLRTMYEAMVRYDAWLVEYRNTRGTGGVEAFCTFDTGHDLSPRFWHVPDRGYLSDARLVDPASPTLPFIAPDLTANVACQRSYLALIATELGLDPAPWLALAAQSVAALYEQCYDAGDAMFYDRDVRGELVSIQSDVLLRVLACEVGDDAFFAAALTRYLMNTGKFLGHYGLTSLALDDPRFDHDYTRNSWGGPSNFLTMIRAPHAFEVHGRVAELALVNSPVLSALASADRFPQCLDPWTGAPGFTSAYSPSILWMLDALERACGILPRPDGSIWLSGLIPTRLEHGAAAAATAYSRVLDGVLYELAGDDTSVVVHRDGSRWLSFPRGWRVVISGGSVAAVVGLAAAPVTGTLAIDGSTSRDANGVVASSALDLTLAPNESVSVGGTGLALAAGARTSPGFIPPHP